MNFHQAVFELGPKTSKFGIVKVTTSESFKKNVIYNIFHTAINYRQLETNDKIIALIFKKYDAFSSCIDHKNIIFKS